MNSIPAAAAGSAEALRALLRERFPEAHTPPRAEDGAALKTGCAALDRIGASDAGGIPRGTITEVVQTRASSGGALLIGQLVEGAAARGRALVLIDGRDSFNPEEFSSTTLQRLLWIRASSCTEVMQASDLLLRDGNLPLIVIDLALNPQQEMRCIPSSSWYRLRSLAEESSAVLITITPAETVPAPHLRIILQQHFTLAAFEQPRGELELVLKASRRQARPIIAKTA